MKRLLNALLGIIFLGITPTLFAQGVGINSSGNPPAPGTILDVSSIDKAVLLPRTTTDNISSPVEGMVIYDTTAHQFHYYNGMQWCALLEEGAYQFYWADEDGDGYGYPFNVIYSPNPPEFFVANNDDCDDTNPDLHPGAEEICDGLDNDCDGLVDGDDPDIMGIPTSWLDADGDGYGDPMEEINECPVPDGYVSNNLDCDDSNGNVYPGADEVCDGFDNDCDGFVDLDDPSITDAQTYYEDADSDGFGNSDVSVLACEPPPGYSVLGGDCDDSNPNSYPGGVEFCDTQDNDCDGQIDEDYDFNSDANNCGGCGISCDDGIPCTLDQCDSGVCNNPIDGSSCFINGQCYADGEINPDEPCLMCNASMSQTSWSNAPDGMSCPNGGVCNNGICQQ